jgi:hypothetical protein
MTELVSLAFQKFEKFLELFGILGWLTPFLQYRNDSY